MTKNFWHLGNTTMRRWHSRVYKGLKALQSFKIPYGRKKIEIEKLYSEHLAKHNVITIGDRPDYDDFARKFIAIMKQFGLVLPNISRPRKGKWVLNDKNQDPKLLKIIDSQLKKTGCHCKPWEITPLGEELINATNNYFIQRVFQKIFILYRLPSPLEKKYDCKQFSPLKLLIKVLKKTKHISFYEFLLFIITNFDDNNINEVIENILSFRKKFKEKKGKEKDLAIKLFTQKKITLTQFESGESYVDISFDYFKATGIFYSKGKKILIREAYAKFADQIIELIDKYKSLDDNEYCNKLWSGNFEIILNKDSLNNAIKNLNNFFDKIKFQIPQKIKTTENNENKLIELKVLQEEKTEEIFYKNQEKDWKNISSLLANITNKQILLDKDVIIPRKPEILEWAVWKSLLAINDIKCEPSQTRLFNIDLNDEYLLPLDDARSGYEDLFFQFANYNLTVEVTYSEGPKQETMEGISVRQHLIKRMLEYKNKKDVYALFIAPAIDLNTFQTLNTPFYYGREKKKYSGLKIIPLTIKQYNQIFSRIMKQKTEIKNLTLKKIFDDLIVNKETLEPEAWREKIKNIVEQRIN